MTTKRHMEHQHIASDSPKGKRSNSVKVSFNTPTPVSQDKPHRRLTLKPIMNQSISCFTNISYHRKQSPVTRYVSYKICEDPKSDAKNSSDEHKLLPQIIKFVQLEMPMRVTVFDEATGKPVYEGQWKGGSPNGYGIYFNESGEKEYEGNFQKGKSCDNKILFYTTPERYTPHVMKVCEVNNSNNIV